jgi:hypothetical protein
MSHYLRSQILKYKVYGDISFRDKNCPHETPEHMAFVNWVKKTHPVHYDMLIHPKNEGVRTHHQAAKDRALGSLNAGASDIIILGKTPFVCELKRKDKTLSRLSDKQKSFLNQAVECGCFACVAYGAEAVIEAFEDWLEECN